MAKIKPGYEGLLEEVLKEPKPKIQKKLNKKPRQKKEFCGCGVRLEGNRYSENSKSSAFYKCKKCNKVYTSIRIASKKDSKFLVDQIKTMENLIERYNDLLSGMSPMDRFLKERAKYEVK